RILSWLLPHGFRQMIFLERASFFFRKTLSASLQLSRSQCIALGNIASLKPTRKPANSLFTRAVRETFRDNHTFSLLLQCIITDLCGSVQGFLNVSLLQPAL